MLKPIYLTRRDIVKLEEVLDSADLETMVAVVDRIVKVKLARATRGAGQRRKEDPAIQARTPSELWFMKKFYEFDGTNRQQILSDMRVQLATLPEDEREICGWYAEGIANEYHHRD